MSGEGLGMTARITAAARAQENERSDRLFDDPFAGALAGDEGFRWKQELYPTPAENPTIGPRTRFLDDLVLDAIKGGLLQIVLVAAGMDTRAFRLPLPPATVVFELDQERLLQQKQAVLDADEAVARCRRIIVPADLAEERWPASLINAGFMVAHPSVFLVEGLSTYLTDGEMGRLLDHLATLAGPGSRLGIDITSRTSLDNPALAPFLEATAARGIYWRFGTDDPAGLLAAHGWRAEVRRFDLVCRDLGRWPPPSVSEEVAARAASANPYFFIRAGRSGPFPERVRD